MTRLLRALTDENTTKILTASGYFVNIFRSHIAKKILFKSKASLISSSWHIPRYSNTARHSGRMIDPADILVPGFESLVKPYISQAGDAGTIAINSFESLVKPYISQAILRTGINALRFESLVKPYISQAG